MGFDLTQYSRLPVPDEDAARDVPYWLSLLASALDTKLPLFVASVTERDATLSAAARGTIVVNTADGTVWVKTSASTTAPPTWGTLFTPATAIVWTPIPLRAGYTNSGFSSAAEATMVDGWVELRGSFGKTDGSALTNGPGTANVFGDLPGSIKLPPTGAASFAVACGFHGSDPTGRLFIHSDGSLEFNVNSTSYWADLHGVRYYVG